MNKLERIEKKLADIDRDLVELGKQVTDIDIRKGCNLRIEKAHLLSDKWSWLSKLTSRAK